jgi:tetratricopeptide (TPR) repeat protein
MSLVFNIGMILSSKGQYDEAASKFQLAMTVYESLYGASHPQVLNSKRALAGMMSRYLKYDEALPLFESILPDFEKSLGWEHLDTLAVAMQVALLTWIYRNDLDKAMGLYFKCLEYYTLMLGEDNEFCLQCKQYIGSIHWELKNYNEASVSLEHVLRHRLDARGWGSTEVYDISSWLADIYRQSGQLDKVVSSLKRQYEGLCKSLGESNSKTLIIGYNLAAAYCNIGEQEQALKYFHDILKLNEDKNEEKNNDLSISIKNVLEQFSNISVQNLENK